MISKLLSEEEIAKINEKGYDFKNFDFPFYKKNTTFDKYSIIYQMVLFIAELFRYQGFNEENVIGKNVLHVVASCIYLDDNYSAAYEMCLNKEILKCREGGDKTPKYKNQHNYSIRKRITEHGLFYRYNQDKRIIVPTEVVLKIRDFIKDIPDSSDITPIFSISVISKQ